MRAITQLREVLVEYCEQDRLQCLLLSGTDPEVGLALKTLEHVESTNETDLFFRFIFPFESADRWVAQCAGMVAAMLEDVDARRARDNLSPLTPLDRDAALDARLAPTRRLGALLRHLLTLPVADPHARIVLALLPVSIADAHGYATLVGAAAELIAPHPCARLLARELAGEAPLREAMGGLRLATASHPLRLDAASLGAAIAEDAADPTLEPDARMRALLQLAFVDLGYRRFDAALERLAQLVPYYASAGPPAFHAIALAAVGDVAAQQRSDWAYALDRYRQAAAVAVESKDWPIVRNAALSAAKATARLSLHSETIGYCEVAARLSRDLLEPVGYIEARTLEGDAHRALGQPKRAEDAWKDAEQTAARAGDSHRRRPALERLLALYRDAALHRERAEVERELAALACAHHAGCGH